MELADKQLEAVSGGDSAWDEITGDPCDSYDPGEGFCNDYH